MIHVGIENLINDFDYYNQKYKDFFFHKGHLLKEKLTFYNVGIAIERFSYLNEMIKNVKTIRYENYSIEVASNTLIISIPIKEAYEFVKDEGKSIILKKSEPILKLILDFQMKFNCYFRITIDDNSIKYEIIPVFEIHQFVLAVNNTQNLMDIKKFAENNSIKIEYGDIEKKILFYNPHLKNILVWENFVLNSIVYCSRQGYSNSWSIDKNGYTIKKEIILQDSNYYRLKYNESFGIDKVMVEDIDKWKQLVLKDYYYCKDLDSKYEDLLFYRSQQYSDFEQFSDRDAFDDDEQYNDFLLGR